MSRVAKKPITVPSQVQVKLNEQSIHFKGPLGELSHAIPSEVSVLLESGSLQVQPISKDKRAQAQAGMLRAKLYNQVKGVLEGFSASLVLVKVGANAQIDGNHLVLKIGFSNPKHYHIAEGVNITTPTSTEICIKGVDIQKVNQVAAEIIKIRPPEVYKGTGILKKGQRVKLKAAKKK